MHIPENPVSSQSFWFPALLMNVIIFIISVLKLLFMHGKYFFLVFALIVVFASTAAGSLTKITAGAPVYIGEQNLDISSGLQGCRVIDWWADGADTDSPPQKNVSIIKTLDDSNIAFGYTISPEIYSGYTGTWYCEGKRPLRAVFEVLQPQISVRFWDLENDTDVSGKTIPVTANITYRIDTNLDKALQLRYRPEMTSLDSFYTISLTDPGNKVLSSVFTGSYGKPDSRGLIFDRKPIITASPFFWKDGSVWDRTSRNMQGDLYSPLGTYTITVDQDLNKMKELWEQTTPENRAGVLGSSATVTFIKPESTPGQTVSVPVTTSSEMVTTESTVTPEASQTTVTIPPTLTPVPTKTTYAPLPLWVVVAALGMALACAARQKK
jgi:hypothetical protein